MVTADPERTQVVLPRDFVVAPDLKEESQKLAIHVSAYADLSVARSRSPWMMQKPQARCLDLSSAA